MHTWFGLLVWIFGTPDLFSHYLSGINWYALGIAVLTPALMLVVRHEVRLSRLRAILDFIQNYDLPELRQTTASTAPSKARQGKENLKLAKRSIDEHEAAETASHDLSEDRTEKEAARENPSFEYVKSKYISDLKIATGTTAFKRLYAATTDSDRIEIYIDIASRPFRNVSWRLYAAAIGFMLVSYYGFKTLFLAFGYRGTDLCNAAAGCGIPLSEAVGAFAFAGAFVVAARMLIRRLAVFDLNAYSFLWHSIEIIATVLIVILLYNAFPDPWAEVKGIIPLTTKAAAETTPASNGTQQNPASATTEATSANEPSAPNGSAPISQIPLIWLALAPALGLMPQSATTFLFSKLRGKILFKTADDRFTNVTRETTLDIIDGIDFSTRFRLEESGIFDVQNLATYNPIMLFIETPYGIYQCIDWIAQAQLCHILGPEKFLIFREMNMRTIFDLERAIDSIYSPDAYDAICAAILFSPTDSLAKVVGDTGFKFTLIDGNETKLADIPDYFKWLHQQLAVDGTTKAVEHLSAWISDDLHVRRLRRIWNDVAKKLEPNSEYLTDSKRNPYNRQKMEEIAAQRAARAAGRDASTNGGQNGAGEGTQSGQNNISPRT